MVLIILWIVLKSLNDEKDSPDVSNFNIHHSKEQVEWRITYSQELYQLYCSPDIITTKNIYQASLHINDPREDLNLGGKIM
jgi:hypothetical protein